MNPVPFIPTTTLVPTDQIPQDPQYKDLRIIRFQSNENDRNAYSNRRYAFQHDIGQHNVVKAVLTRKGVVADPKHVRIAAFMHPTLKAFIDLVRYDPANPPKEAYGAHGMIDAHKQTQADFKGQKQQNRDLFKTYILEGYQGTRSLYLPVVSGWQSSKSFEKTIFVAFDESDPDALYGELYLPKDPIMQSDGQTQTAALFAAADSKDVAENAGFESLRLTLEVELNMDERRAGQSFADRNGRGSKKNKNLVIGMDTSSPLSDIRTIAVKGTVFENRIADGRSSGVSQTSTENIVDLSTIEQMILAVVFGNYREKPERLKHHHVALLVEHVQEFFQLLDEVFGPSWPGKTPRSQDTYRHLYVHGWGFAQKALATAFHRVRRDKLDPIIEAIRVRPTGGQTMQEAFTEALEQYDEQNLPQPEISFDEFKKRLKQTDWLRYRQHWVKITGASQKDGNNVPAKLKSISGVVSALAPNTPAIVAAVADKILSPNWRELTSDVNAPL